MAPPTSIHVTLVALAVTLASSSSWAQISPAPAPETGAADEAQPGGEAQPSDEATPPDDRTDVDRDAARTLVQQGDERLERKDYEGALVAYRRADDIMGVPTTSIEVGRVAALLGRLVEAREAFERAANYPPSDDEPEPFTRARAEAAHLAEATARRIPTLTVTVEGPASSEVAVLVDGEERLTWNAPMLLDPGPHTVAARATGYEPKETAFSLEERETRSLTLRLDPKDEPVAPLTIVEAEPPYWPLAIAGFSVAGAGLLIGSITGGLSLADASEAKEHCGEGGACSPDAEGPLDRSRTLAHVSTTSLVLAGVGAGLGGVMLYLALTDDRAEGARTELVVSPSQVGLRGHF